MENAERAGADRGCRLFGIDASSGSLETDQTDLRMGNEVLESTDRIGTAADTGQNGIRKLSFFFQDLFFDLLGNDRLEITDDRGEGMGPHAGTQDIMRVGDPAGPFSHGFGNGIL